MNPNFAYLTFHKPIEFRSVKKAGYLERGLQGYAIVYDSESRDMGGFTEVLKHGAFTESLKKGLDVRLLAQHQSGLVMARESAGNLVLREDEHGVSFTADLVDTSLNRDIVANIEARNLDAMSFGMPKASIVGKFERSGKRAHFNIERADVVEISVVTWAAYEATTVAARSAEEFNQFLQQSAANQSTPVGVLRTRQELAKRRY